MAQSARDLVRLAEDRRKVGPGSDKDVALARADVRDVRGMRSASRASPTNQASSSLEAILGRYPATELQAAPALPAFPGPVPVGIPVDMLEPAPTSFAAERRVAGSLQQGRRSESRPVADHQAECQRFGNSTAIVLQLQEDFE